MSSFGRRASWNYTKQPQQQQQQQQQHTDAAMRHAFRDMSWPTASATMITTATGGGGGSGGAGIATPTSLSAQQLAPSESSLLSSPLIPSYLTSSSSSSAPMAALSSSSFGSATPVPGTITVNTAIPTNNNNNNSYLSPNHHVQLPLAVSPSSASTTAMTASGSRSDASLQLPGMVIRNDDSYILVLSSSGDNANNNSR